MDRRPKDTQATDAVGSRVGGRTAAADAPDRVRRKPSLLAGGLVLWIGAIALGFVVLARYHTTPSAHADPGDVTPGTSVQLAEDRHTLIISVHPKCPCTKASIDELANVLRTTAQADLPQLQVYVRTASSSAITVADGQWAIDKLSAFGPVTVNDVDGTLSEPLGILTSGHVLLYAPDGTLKFSGGVTASRGHRGANAGASALALTLQGKSIATQTGAVFGCPIQNQTTN